VPISLMSVWPVLGANNQSCPSYLLVFLLAFLLAFLQPTQIWAAGAFWKQPWPGLQQVGGRVGGQVRGQAGLADKRAYVEVRGRVHTSSQLL